MVLQYFVGQHPGDYLFDRPGTTLRFDDGASKETGRDYYGIDFPINRQCERTKVDEIITCLRGGGREEGRATTSGIGTIYELGNISGILGIDCHYLCQSERLPSVVDCAEHSSLNSLCIAQNLQDNGQPTALSSFNTVCGDCKLGAVFQNRLQRMYSEFPIVPELSQPE